MSSELTLTILLAGLITFLLRWLPFRYQGDERKPLPPTLQKVLLAIGPAAIAALLTVSLVPMVSTSPLGTKGLGACAALLSIALYKRYFGGIALPTLLGALVFGVAHYFFKF
ncbi:AzlD domain-containing protein [Vreelandella utahensis]|uniref:AzlD domain-containing protein n=1 Tax=Vreelandella halophila TaxID=86177 RepID=UPI000987670D|nr:AzlD domain-containing protein [Halomonas utahensis]